MSALEMSSEKNFPLWNFLNTKFMVHIKSVYRKLLTSVVSKKPIENSMEVKTHAGWQNSAQIMVIFIYETFP